MGCRSYFIFMARLEVPPILHSEKHAAVGGHAMLLNDVLCGHKAGDVIKRDYVVLSSEDGGHTETIRHVFLCLTVSCMNEFILLP